ncbi:DUF2199 domain-containing protein [Epilithonimonas ginsengisoli]|uniref:DUF2199 domain-containing protein n=1 Tax=Epilithonimonas ginsengisoli TaxID=1245592 RepID=A0ABU4JJ15_9FLAO|nr:MULTISPECIES: DUF2199 domain-containing protein [Chryseobacterium group]MBV6880836.1 DUF2199 domain-containing protein [Epilithonimonas sp. FP105]MDW8549594.1 DUF2199 domain-containing protein [Epilithonimonas ginsengisoli]OAH76724.1 hypothetical protein AXA65_00115 [Chryseobacterium sp. FP211-J200]
MKLFPFFNKKEKKVAYKCSCCGKVYDELPLCFGSDYPNYYFSIPSDERETRIELKESLCVVDEKCFFHRGRLTIPIIDYNENLIFNVWTSISEDNFGKRMDLWENPNRVNEEPYFGWLQTNVSTYGETLNIKTIAIEQNVGLIPEIKSIEEGHLLTIDQENGITYKRAVEIVDEIMKYQHSLN